MNEKQINQFYKNIDNQISRIQQSELKIQQNNFNNIKKHYNSEKENFSKKRKMCKELINKQNYNRCLNELNIKHYKKLNEINNNLRKLYLP